MKKQDRIFLLLAIVCLAIATFIFFVAISHSEQIYTYKNEDGNTVYTNVPPGKTGVQKFMETPRPSSGSCDSVYGGRGLPMDKVFDYRECIIFESNLPAMEKASLLIKLREERGEFFRTRFFEKYGQ